MKLSFPQRILVATNLFGRGMDIERVNIVFNYDMPEDSDTYLHRVARAGRFGTKGLAITFVSDENDAKILNNVQDRFDVNITELPDEIDLSSYSKFSSFPKLNVFWQKSFFSNSRRTISSKKHNHKSWWKWTQSLSPHYNISPTISVYILLDLSVFTSSLSLSHVKTIRPKTILIFHFSIQKKKNHFD